MSIESANEFLSKLFDKDESVLALIPKDADPKALTSKSLPELANAGIAAGWDFTIEELEEVYFDSLKLEESELKTVAGGICEPCINLAQVPKCGGCSSNYFAEQCLDTVKDQDGCNCVDYDTKADHYHPC